MTNASFNKKYNEFKHEIKLYKWHPNQYGGFYLRELIPERTLYKLILSSNSKISKTFKNDVSEILENLRKEDQLEITNEKITNIKTTK